MGAVSGGRGARPPAGPLTLSIIEVVRATSMSQKMSGSALARKAGLSVNTVLKILRGASAPTTDQLQDLCAALGVSVVAVVVRATRRLET